MSGKRGTAPCGHRGFHVTANYVTCAVGCDGRARCKKCGSDKTEPFRLVGLPPDTMRCIPCGSVHWPGLDEG